MSHLYSHRPQYGRGYKETSRSDEETRWAVPTQACESGPIKAGGEGLKETGALRQKLQRWTV